MYNRDVPSRLGEDSTDLLGQLCECIDVSIRIRINVEGGIGGYGIRDFASRSLDR